MEDLKFNIHAFTRPSTDAERSALLDEALRTAEDLESMIDELSATLAANAADRVCKAAAKTA